MTAEPGLNPGRSAAFSISIDILVAMQIGVV
jgi:hypothetical protein